MSAQRSPERPLGDLFGDLARETGTLVRQEVQLVRTEMAGKAKEAAKEAAFVGVGGALMHSAVILLAVAAVAGMATFMPVWAAALIVGVVVAAIGFALLSKGMTGLKRIEPAPARTIRTIKENELWAKRELRR